VGDVTKFIFYDKYITIAISFVLLFQNQKLYLSINVYGVCCDVFGEWGFRKRKDDE